MAFRLSRSAFARIAAPAARVGGRNAPRRAMSSSSHGSKGSDQPWMIGSALVFGPAILYLLSPSSQEKAHKAQQHSLPKEKAPGDAPVPASPPPQEQAPVEPAPEPSAVTDDEGTKVSAEEVTESMNKSFEDDSPKDAYAAEAGKQTDSESSEPNASGDKAITEKAEAPEGEHEQASKSDDAPANEKDASGTLQSKEDVGPSNVGDARAESKSGNAPKEARKE